MILTTLAGFSTSEGLRLGEVTSAGGTVSVVERGVVPVVDRGLVPVVERGVVPVVVRGVVPLFVPVVPLRGTVVSFTFVSPGISVSRRLAPSVTGTPLRPCSVYVPVPLLRPSPACDDPVLSRGLAG